ncbi:hypothetical protein MKQ70_30085 [Chitinophaga sedimenti]|uniref:hypothetical protein n=1 Tax=Chitinophaga sedimenti TaxID=2033606 RepID=UPI0020052420|nr:hypothetical protein [Chitinophaga sedimenti]MCK7558999.1 hypothetical protein [Chitinophaga sedimenti]
MKDLQDILMLAIQQPAMNDQLKLAESDAVAVPDCLDFTLQRFTYDRPLPVEDVAMVVYQPAKRGQSAAIELRYCVAGSKYCTNPGCTDQVCAGGNKRDKESCNERVPSVDMITVRFQPGFIQSLQKEILPQHSSNCNQRSRLRKPLHPALNPNRCSSKWCITTTTAF